MNKEVTILIPFNKDRGFLDEAIKSADGQADILLSQSDGSCAHNINEGAKQVKTKYFVILAEDDILTHDSIECRYRTIIEGHRWIHARGAIFGRGYEMPYTLTVPDPTVEEMLIINRINGGTVMYETELFLEYGGFDESLHTAEEYDFHLRLMIDGIMPGYCPSLVHKYRRHDKQKSLGRSTNQSARQKFIKDLVDKHKANYQKSQQSS